MYHICTILLAKSASGSHGSIHLRPDIFFRPLNTNTSKLGDLSAPAFKDRCTLELRNIIEAIEMEGQGDKKFTKLTPVATFLAEQEQPEP